MKKRALVPIMALLISASLGQTAQAAPVQAPIIGEIERITINNANDPWSGGTIVVDGAAVILPKNLLIDLPANRVTLKHLFDQAPAACLATGETGLAKADVCNATGAGGLATIAANMTNGGNTIAGDVFIQKGVESVTGPVTYINHTDGYFRINGVPGDPNTGIMIRINDPTSRHTVQQGLGCAPVNAATGRVPSNCSPDPRFTLDPDNYVIVFTTGYPACIPSTVPRQFQDVLGLGVTTAQSTAIGTGDVLCPATNRSANLIETVNDSRLFAPIQLGDNVTAEGNFETINCVRFVSAHTMKVAKALITKNLPNQPDYMFFEEAFIDAPGFQNKRARALFIGFTTLAPADVLIWSIHRDPATNTIHEFPLGTTRGCDTAAGPLQCTGQGIIPGGGDIFRIRYDVDFLVGAKPTLNPCAQLRADARMGAGICPAGGSADLNITEQFAILSPMPHEIQGRTGHKLANPGLITLDINGNQATNGQYLFPFGIGLGGIDIPNFLEINPALVQTPYSFSGIPWNLDRRLSPGGCLATGCDAAPQPLDPFPFEGLAMDPRLQDPNLPHGAYNDPNFTNTALTDASNRILSYVRGTAFAGGKFNFGGNTTLLTWPPADPAALPIPVIPPVSPQQPLVTITSAPVSTTTVGQPYSYQVTAQNFALCGGLTYTLDLAPAGMTVGAATGLIQWIPTAAQAGPQSVIVRATEPGGAFDTQSFGIVVASLPPVVKAVKNDFDKDRKTDFAVWRGGDGTWYIVRSSDRGATATQWGTLNDKPVAGDYDGDGQTDLAVWRPSDGNWYIRNSSNGTVTQTNWGTGTVFATPDVPIPGDYDGDAKTDLAVWRPSDGNWYIRNSSNGTVTQTNWGTGTVFATPDVPVPGDYDGDGKTDLAVWRPSDGNWYIRNSANGTVTQTNWGTGTVFATPDVPVPGDYDGDGKTDIAVWRPSDGNWYVIHSSTGAVTTTQLGAAADIPVPGDYDGDGKTDLAVWRPADGNWYIIPSGIGIAVQYHWGGDPTDVPLGKVIQ